jgi:hypothetical protein
MVAPPALSEGPAPGRLGAGLPTALRGRAVVWWTRAW